VHSYYITKSQSESWTGRGFGSGGDVRGWRRRAYQYYTIRLSRDEWKPQTRCGGPPHAEPVPADSIARSLYARRPGTATAAVTVEIESGTSDDRSRSYILLIYIYIYICVYYISAFVIFIVITGTAVSPECGRWIGRIKKGKGTRRLEKKIYCPLQWLNWT